MENKEKPKKNIQESNSTMTLHPSYRPHYRNDDLKYFIRDFVEEQKRLLEIEKQEEEMQTLNNISLFYAKELEKMGVCLRKLDLIETYFESYGKYLTLFQKRTTKDMANKLGRYKFGNGDTVGLFEYSEKVHNEVLYQGVVLEFTEKKIIVAFDREIKADDLPKNICLVQLCNQVTYERIRTGLDSLENNDIPEDSLTLVRTLFGIREPTFQNEFISDEEKQKFSFNFFNQDLNISQKQAVKFSLEANELALIHGPPGTGKTTTISELILQGVSQGMKILVVAPSNIAVDNIAEKLMPFRKALNIDMCRIGHPARVMESIHEIALDTKVEKSSNTKFVKDIKREIEKKRKELTKTDKKEERRNLKSELRSLREDIKGSYRTTVIDIFSKCKIILATCVGAADQYLKESLNKYNSGTFDLVVIDECAQATESLCWLSILLGKKLVLAGDHLQLPPTIKSKEAEKGLSFTLFDRMIKQFGEKCCKLLDIQYRMNEKIMNFSSMELYAGKLHAHDSVKSHKVLDLIEKEDSENPGSLSPTIDDKVGILDQNLLLFNTNGFEFYESVDIDSTSRFNIGEAKICKFLIDYLKSQKIDYSNIGIITPYSAQVNTLRNIFPVEEYKELEVSTVDGFQGREKEIIILSLVRSNKRREVGFLADSRRLNVAITRAKRMVALICDSGTVSNHPFMKKMVDYFDKEAYDVGLLENVFDFRDIEDIKYECMKNSEKEKEHTKDLQKKEKDCKLVPVNGQTQAQAKKNKKNKKNKKESENSEKIDGNIPPQEINNDEFAKQGREKSNSEGNTIKHKHAYKKEDVNLEFINKIKLLIEDFVNSKEEQYKIEGLSNSERKYIHYYAEIKHLIHESQGEGENRVMILRKPSKSKTSPEKRKSAEQNTGENSHENLSQQNIQNSISKENKQSLEKVEQVENISITTEKKILPQNKIEKNKGGIIVNPEISNKNKNIKTVATNHKIKTENDWDELDNLLDQFQTQDKSKCNFNNCTTTSNNSLCHFCNFYFCINHLRGVVHDCVIYNKQESHYTEVFLKNRINSKINELEEKRNKQPPKKKKK